MARRGPGASFTDHTPIGTAATTVAVKDLINLAGMVTTPGCRAIARIGLPA
ncbi:MAG TPA: hypothetical protein VMF55_08215 [Solirubrobacterales bacterium]|nr:hypothetical protein [Solirubrobacterales bacterium]